MIIDKSYPSDFSNEEIERRILSYTKAALYAETDTLIVKDPTYYVQMAQLGHNELASRSQKSFSKASKRLNSMTIGLAIVTISLAATTIWYSQRDMESDQTWRDDQMTELKRNNDLLQEQIRVESERYMELNALIMKNNESNKEN